MIGIARTRRHSCQARLGRKPGRWSHRKNGRGGMGGRSRRAAAVFLLTSFAGLTGSARSAPPAEGALSDTVRLSLGEALTRAEAQSPRLDQLRALDAAAAAGLRWARAARFPQLDLSAGFTRYSEVPAFSFTPPAGPPLEIFPNLPDNYRSRLSFTSPLFTGGRLSAASAAAGREHAAAQKDLQAGEADLILEVTNAYWSIVTARESERVLREALLAYESHLNDARNRETVGMAARNELLSIEVERDRAELNRLRATNAAEAANANLVRLLGLPGSTEVVATDRLETQAGGADRTSDEPRATAGAAALREADSQAELALAARPERTALAARLAAAEARVRVEARARWPQVSAVLGYDYSNPNRRITPPRALWDGTWDASVLLSLPLFDSGRISASAARARAQAAAVQSQLSDLDRRIRLEVTSRTLDLQSAEAAVPVADRALEAARENRKVTQDRYREGLGSSSDLLDAEVVWLRAGLERLEAQARLRLARAALVRALGESP